MTRWTATTKKQLLTLIDYLIQDGHQSAADALRARLGISPAEEATWRNGQLRANPQRSQAFKRAA